MFENPELCKKCGGSCCKFMPGANFPEDFNLPSKEKLEIALKSGLYTIDWWEGDPRPNKNKLSRGYFIRPAIKGKEGKTTDPTWGGVCTFLSRTGCKLSSDERPTNCKMIEPRPEKEGCILHDKKSKQGSAVAWIPYHKIIKKFIDEEE